MPGSTNPLSESIRSLISRGRRVLLEHELFPLLAASGLPVPEHRYLPLNAVKGGGELDLGPLSGGRGVLKVLSPSILHKSDLGCVTFLGQVTPAAVREAARAMLDGLPAELRGSVRGVVLERAVPHTPGVGRELLLGLRRSPELGSVFTLGFGGTYVEAMSAATRPEQSTILFKPGVTSRQRLTAKLERSLFFRWASGGVRGVAGVTSPRELREQLESWVAALEQITRAVEACGRTVQELELNPLVWDEQQLTWMPVDALLRMGPAAEQPHTCAVPRLRRGLDPRRVAIMGASSRGMNVGRIILRSMLEGGFPREAVFPIHPEAGSIDGVPCLRGLEQLDGPVDLLVLAVAAPAVPAILEQTLSGDAVQGAVLLIPGGMGETEEGQGIEQQVLEILERAGPERPALIGNNSLGFVSRGARFDSLFIPRTKLPRVEDGLPNVALISQSGAFMISALTKLDFLSPAYQISVGNQIDARVSHFVEALVEEPDLTTLGLYVEGLKPGDGEALAALVHRLVAAGRDVVLYKAGRSALGQQATLGHTASVAGDYRVLVEVLQDAGALVAQSFSDFLDLMRLSATLRGRQVTGRRVGLMSNAGYEAVGLADNHQGLQPASFSRPTVHRLEQVLKQAGLDRLVTVKNPLDLTPMAGDRVHVDCMAAILDDPELDAAVFGNVPLTAMIQSLPHGVDEDDVFDSPRGYASLTIELFRRARKPFVVVIDGGRLYDPLADHLQRAGLPVFRSGDRAVRMLARYLEARTV